MNKMGCCVDKKCDATTCMNLPSGETCGSCLHIRRCFGIGYTPSPDETSCSFFPRRFRKMVEAKSLVEIMTGLRETGVIPADIFSLAARKETGPFWAETLDALKLCVEALEIADYGDQPRPSHVRDAIKAGRRILGGNGDSL